MERRKQHSIASLAAVSQKILEVVQPGEIVTSKEIAERTRQVNAGYRIRLSAINKTLSTLLKDRFIPCGKKTWRVEFPEQPAKETAQ